MNELDRGKLMDFVTAEIAVFHERRLDRLRRLDLPHILRTKNPYLFRTKNLLTAADLVQAIMDAFLSSSEEKMFGDFLESLAVYVSEQTCNGTKSTAPGIDLEFDRSNYRYLVSIKSGPNWGNSSQQAKLRQDFLRASIVQRQARTGKHIQGVEGICYGKSGAVDRGGFVRLTGQSFWYFLSGDPRLYIDIIEPIGHDAKRHNERFVEQRAVLVNQLTAEFTKHYCTDYRVDWEKLVAYNSGNLGKGDSGIDDALCPCL